MRCKDIELLILDSRERKLTQSEVRTIEQHLALCTACTAFKNDLVKLRNGVNHLRQPAPSADLFEKTQALCREELAATPYTPAGFGLKLRRFPIPKFIWISIPVIMGITTYLMLPGLKDLAAQSRSLQSLTVLTIILQNAALLVLAPILIKSLRRRRESISWNHYDAHAS
jgi:hypothetical protein